MSYQCKRCGESFTNTSSLKRHLDKEKICEAVISKSEPLVLLKELKKQNQNHRIILFTNRYYDEQFLSYFS